jgi:hypothetical protein
VRALLADGEDAVHIAELAHGLAYWAARWQPVPGTETQRQVSPAAAETGRRAAAMTPAAALAAVPRIADQSGGFRDLLPRLAKLPGWPTALAAAPAQVSADDARAWLAGLADAAVFRYLDYGHGNPVMMVHSATAPTAILRTLPALSQDLWAPSAAAAWDAAAAITAIYAPPVPAPRESLTVAPTGPGAADEAFARAVRNGDEHAIKFADTAAEVHARTGDPAALAAATHAAALLPGQT